MSKYENATEKAIALLKKMNVNVLPEGSAALYNKALALLTGEESLEEEVVEETPEEPAEETPTADEVMEEKLEAETDESVGQEPEPEEVKPE
jgi:hypothetical protein